MLIDVLYFCVHLTTECFFSIHNNLESVEEAKIDIQIISFR
jgi:hypothetical protein